MKNPEARKKLNVVLKAALWGAVLFTVVSVVIVMFDHFFGGNFLYLLDIPTECLNHFTGWEHASATNYVNSNTFPVIVNGLLGAILFALIASFQQFIMKGED